MFDNTCLNTTHTPSSEEIWAEFLDAYKAFFTNTGQNPTHVIVPADKLLKIYRCHEIRIRHHLDRPDDGCRIVDILLIDGNWIGGIFNNCITINGYKVIESAQGGNILFGYLPEKE